jgi:multidrug efflux system outer membrane protein
VEAARLRHRAARSAWFPSFELTANGGQASTTLGDLLSDAARSFGLNLLLSLPIFDGGRRAARTRRAAAEVDLAHAEQRAAILAAFRDVEDALTDTKASRDDEANARTAADAAGKALTIARVREAAGSISRADLLLVQRTERDARRRLVSAGYVRAGAAVSLVRALGGGWGPAIARPLDLAANDRH